MLSPEEEMYPTLATRLVTVMGRVAGPSLHRRYRSVVFPEKDAPHITTVSLKGGENPSSPFWRRSLAPARLPRTESSFFERCAVERLVEEVHTI